VRMWRCEVPRGERRPPRKTTQHSTAHTISNKTKSN
jgi:hypothetical protein